MMLIFGEFLGYGKTNIKMCFSKLLLPWLPSLITPSDEESTYL